MRIWDISPLVVPGIPVWPGDAPYQARRTHEIGPDSPARVSEVTFSTHTGAHVDAPCHFDPEGASIDQLDLATYMGPVRVVDARGLGRVITPMVVRGLFDSADAPARVLFRTWERAPSHWTPDFCGIAPDTISYLADRAVVLVGIDTPSIDPFDADSLPAHRLAGKRGVAILEGIVLDDIAEGDYELIALPLKLAELDASPVRAVLRSLA